MQHVGCQRLNHRWKKYEKSNSGVAMYFNQMSSVHYGPLAPWAEQ